MNVHNRSRVAIRTRLEFLNSVKRNYPALYSAAVKRGGLSGLGITQAEMLAEQDAFAEPVQAVQAKSYLDTAIDAVTKLLPVYVGTKQAQTCISVNADRARQGLPAIDCASGGLAPQFSVGVSPDVKYVLWGVLGLGAVFLLMKKR